MSTVQSLLNYGFTQEDVNQLIYVYNFGGKVTPSILQQLGCTYEQAQRLNYANNISKGYKFPILGGCIPQRGCILQNISH